MIASVCAGEVPDDMDSFIPDGEARVPRQKDINNNKRVKNDLSLFEPFLLLRKERY